MGRNGCIGSLGNRNTLPCAVGDAVLESIPDCPLWLGPAWALCVVEGGPLVALRAIGDAGRFAGTVDAVDGDAAEATGES